MWGRLLESAGRAHAGGSGRRAGSRAKPRVFAFVFEEEYIFRHPMHCPFCQADKDKLKVIDSRACDGDKAIRRRRECLSCGKRFTTYERVEENARVTVIKRDGRRVPWDRAKILAGLERACFKRPVPESELNRIADEAEDEIFARYDREVPTHTIGELVSDKLRRVDQVAYVRFASVHKRFKTIEELMDEAREVLDAKRFDDDPGQGRLFIDEKAPAPKAAAATNGTRPARKAKSAAGDAPAPDTRQQPSAGAPAGED
jgi:transcriptional repressor NrdR